MSNTTPLSAATNANAVAQRIPALGVLLFSLIVLFAVGFMPMSAIHNAAHDTRHATGFPCH